MAGVIYRTVVQAKDWGQPVKQEQLLAFRAILDDLPGQPRGIFVTRTGYQSGALEVARAHGIALYELREPTKEDMEGKITTIHLRISAFVPQSSDIQPIFDQVWVLAERERLGLGPSDALEVNTGGFEDQLLLLNEHGEKVGTFHTALQSMFPAPYVEVPPAVTEHLFNAPTFMLTGNQRFPRLKLLGIRARVSVGRVNQEIVLKAEDFVGFVLHDVIGQKTRLIDKQNRPIKKNEN
jgi:hypothetical protein